MHTSGPVWFSGHQPFFASIWYRYQRVFLLHNADRVTLSLVVVLRHCQISLISSVVGCMWDEASARDGREEGSGQHLLLMLSVFRLTPPLGLVRWIHGMHLPTLALSLTAVHARTLPWGDSWSTKVLGLVCGVVCGEQPRHAMCG
jgi:hypothetical protein